MVLKTAFLETNALFCQSDEIVIDSDEEATVGAACPDSRESFLVCGRTLQLLTFNHLKEACRGSQKP